MKLKATLTAEQREIVLSQARCIHVHAFAGTGKTTVLTEYADARPDKRILYLAYNRTTAQEARAKFGRHVTCMTTHALAWHSHGKKFEHKLGNLRERHVMTALAVDPKLAHFVVKTVEAFLHSARDGLLEEHVPSFVPTSAKTEVLSRANRIWSWMCDVGRKDIPMPHDGYLKLYALSKPSLSSRYDIILFDEAQDANPVTADLIRRQRDRCTIVLVGDPHQAIYRFRGAVDALANADGATILPLTCSFRFGEEIALLNTVFLKLFKGETRQLLGLRKDAGDFLDVRREFPMTHLGRTNATVFRRAFRGLGRHRLHFVGGIESYAFDKLLDVHRLALRIKPIDPFYRSFDSVGELRAYAKTVMDKENIGLIRLTSAYGDEIPHLVDRVKAEAVCDQRDATLILSTTHKSKGLEFRQVKVADDDFEKLVTDDHGLRVMDTPELVEEANLHYVAMTRATHALIPSQEFGLALEPMVKEWRRQELPSHRQLPRAHDARRQVAAASRGRKNS